MRPIDADALMEETMERYCNDCERRKGVKNGKWKIVYSIGDVPCRACGTGDMIDELENAPTISPEPHWIPVTDRLPDEPYGCLVTVWDTEPMTCEEFENILPYFVGWDGEQWNDYDGEQCPFEVIAWMPLPKAYKGGEEDVD